MRFFLAAIFVTAAVFTGCGGRDPQPKGVAAAPTVTVQAVTVSSRAWPDAYEATGTVRARTAAVLSSKVMAYVRQVAVETGDRVKDGQEVVTLDAQDLETNVTRAEAAESEVRSAFPEAESGIAAAKANLELAESTFRRMEELASKKSVSNQEFDEASARRKSAQAAYEMARSKRAQLDFKLSQVAQQIRAAKITREYTRILAPFAGTVTARSVEPGNLAAPGAPLVTIERDGPFRLEASVNESRLPFIKQGQAVEIALDAVDRRLAASVSEIVPAVDSASRAYTVKIGLPSLPNVRSGMFGRAWFPMGVRNVVSIPSAAVIERGQMQTVFVIEDGIAHRRLISTGKRQPEAIEVLSGLNQGETIVSPAAASLQDGARVVTRP
jgi:RND family efflux transporter MFP subunit